MSLVTGVELLDRPKTKREQYIALALIEAEVNRRRWAVDPSLWAIEKLGDRLWSKQRAIFDSVRDYRKTAVPTCHEVGKSFSAGRLAAWWIDTHKPGQAFVITTAPTGPQVKVILWKEIGRAHGQGSLPGRINQTEWMLKVGEREETVGLGRKPNDYSPSAFQGVHAPFVLVIIDEANGVRGRLHDALDSLIANNNSKLLMIGNPDDPAGEFYEACRPNSGFNVVTISAFDSPNFTGEELPPAIKDQLVGGRYVEERRVKWAPSWFWINADGVTIEPAQKGVEPPADGVRCMMPADGKLEDTHPFWQSKVLGQFPVQSSTGSLIPLTWIMAAQERSLEPIGPNELGLDVGASKDGDPSCLGHRRGPVFRVIWEMREPDTMKTTGRLIQALRSPELGASLAKVDYIGVGRGVVDRAKEQNLPVFPIQVGEQSTVFSCRICKHEWDQALQVRKRQQLVVTQCIKCGSNQIWPVFADLLSQLWWSVRGLFERGEIDIDELDHELGAELLNMTWAPNSKGQTKVEYNDDLPSPNRADALLIAYAPVYEEPKPEVLSW